MAKRSTANEFTGQHIDALACEVASLRDEVRVLRDVLAELVEDVQWAIRNNVVPTDIPPDRFRLTSMPIDPCADNFHERVNAVRAEDVHTGSTQQQVLWSE